LRCCAHHVGRDVRRQGADPAPAAKLALARWIVLSPLALTHVHQSLIHRLIERRHAQTDPDTRKTATTPGLLTRPAHGTFEGRNVADSLASLRLALARDKRG
jgi:hypothetical protein